MMHCCGHCKTPALKSFLIWETTRKMNNFQYDSRMLLDFIQPLKYFCMFSRVAFQFQASHQPPVSDLFLLILCVNLEAIQLLEAVLCFGISLSFIRKLQNMPVTNEFFSKIIILMCWIFFYLIILLHLIFYPTFFGQLFVPTLYLLSSFETCLIQLSLF